MRMHELNAGEHGQIISVEGFGALRRRLMDMGLTPGTNIFVRKVAPMGDPIEICVRGYELSLRKEDIKNITVSKLTEINDFNNPAPRGFFGIHGHRRHRGGRL